MARNASRSLYDRISRETRQAMVPEVQAWFLDERNEEIGELAATFLIEFMSGLIGPELYNLALSDTQAVIRQYDDLVQSDLLALHQTPAVQAAPKPGAS